MKPKPNKINKQRTKGKHKNQTNTSLLVGKNTMCVQEAGGDKAGYAVGTDGISRDADKTGVIIAAVEC